MEDSSLRRWNRDDWEIFFGSRGPTIRAITECLGLSCNTEDGGVIKFSEPEPQKLSNAVQKVSQSLPRDLDELLKSASSPDTIDEELDQLLTTHGPAIWGENADRKRLLLAAGNSKKVYPKDLFYEVPVDKQMLKMHLHRWIYKTAYIFQLRKPTRQSAGGDLDPHVESSVVGGMPVSVILAPCPRFTMWNILTVFAVIN
ncbi:hypothetical protein DM02DRAFT_677364 [Periconia macrospinosa]|uniref:Uncharacterized protein n=1 Tax=Periconia macrospinosa TaxID=97972 RepID=A0A2V1D571_9PLEO|nr:hypothetical protein DM02DRAFT_677364 [Periconia macrospinosa]